MNLTDVMRAVWDDTHETNPRTAAKTILTRIPDDQHHSLLLELTDRAYSTFLTTISREPPLEDNEEDDLPQDDGRLFTENDDDQDETTPKPRRSRPAINPRQHRDAVIADLDNRPFHVPSLGVRTRVYFKDMSQEFWEEIAEARRVKASGYLATASWCEWNIRELHNHGVERSGDLPDEVKVKLFEDESATAAEE